MSPGMFDGLDKLISFIMALSAIAIPFAVWKIIEVVFYIFNHLQWAS